MTYELIFKICRFEKKGIFYKKIEIMQTIQASGIVDKNGKLTIEKPLDIRDRRVKILVFINDEYDDSEIDEKEWQKAISNNLVYYFLNDSDEDIYLFSDGSLIKKHTI